MPLPTRPVTFFYPYPDEVGEADRLDPDRDWSFFSTFKHSRQRNWILQSFLRLRRAGHDVQLSTRVPPRGIVVLGPDERPAFRSQGGERRTDLLVLSVRADTPRNLVSDAEAVQNGWYADEQRTFYIPFWPQAGLQARDRTRRQSIASIAYHGYPNNLHPDFRSARWEAFLTERNLRWIVSKPLPTAQGSYFSWNDYTEIDLVLAVRPDYRRPYYHKPASKLINAWRAGVPALLGPEYAYVELRRSALDYIGISSLEAAMEAVDRLLSDATLYRSMVENGLARGADYAPERITERWAEVLFERLPRRAARRSTYLIHRLPPGTRRLLTLLQHPPDRWELVSRMGYLRRLLLRSRR